MILLVVCALAAVSLATRPAPPEPFCTKPGCMASIKCWTDWMDCDNPTGTGDWETISKLKKYYPKNMCPNPTAIEVATVDGISLADAGNVFYANDHITGLICKNADQEKCFCRDYKVRFVCYPPFCGNQKLCWTKWYDRDNPSATGDWELLKTLRKENPGEICANPNAIESRTVDTDTPATVTGQDFLHFSPATGFVCKNGPKQKCRDYKVRFACPCGPVLAELAVERDES
ncbi:cartilage intermediate layer protein 2-like [Clupea harengus]|uniref:Cartilage intermediate layer protein 2-like n=1 Tax=Clupea harengus TaxID=7950 RepID=A0A6P8GSR9_CLUHA|nr:cartilage intermediate layer protein 2-like [Clupea harengus]